MRSSTTVRQDPLALDPAAETERIGASIRHELDGSLKRRGLVVGMSGGVDSSVCAAIAVRAVGASRVLGVFMPERDSDPASLDLARDWAEALGIDAVLENVTPILEGARCYERRDEAIRRVVPEFGAGWKCKLVVPRDRLETDRVTVTSLVVQPPGGEQFAVRLTPDVYRQVVAATNFKQRSRAMMLYYHADRLHYAVLGTPNRLEYDQGFFVKGGDGLADLKPIAHLYKSQVYQLADHLGVPAAITSRPPTTDTFDLPQTQEEFYFALPTAMMDRVLHARNANQPAGEAAEALGLTPEAVGRAYADIDRKRRTTQYLHLGPRLVEPIAELAPV